jgi:flagellar biosynthesis GTPase FlhF
MKIRIIFALTTLIITTSTHAGFGDLLNQAKDMTSVASEASKVINDPTGEKARQEQADKEDRERQERLAREEQARQDRLAREEQARQERVSREKRQAEREDLARKERLDREAREDRLGQERKEQAAHDEQVRKDQAAIQEQERQELIAQQKQAESDRKKKVVSLIQNDREMVLDRCDDWGDVEGEFIGRRNNYPMNVLMCRIEKKNLSARRPVEIDKTFGTITLSNLILKKNKHGDWLVEEITDAEPDVKFNDQDRDLVADMFIQSIIEGEYNSVEAML